MKDFVKKHTHALINVFGIIITALIAIPSEISFYAFLSFVIVAKYPFILLFPLASNIIAYKAVQTGKRTLSVVCSVLFGSIGGFAGNQTNKKIKIIFNIQMWLIVIFAVGFISGLYYAGSHY